MIKNLLYSLFLHFLLLLLIYVNFNIKDSEETKTAEIAVSLVALTGDTAGAVKQTENSVEQKKPDVKEKKETPKEVKSTKQSHVNKVKPQPKRLAKAKPAKAITKPVVEEKIKEFKSQEKPEEVQDDSDKSEEEDVKNENHDKAQNEVTRKEKDLGSKKKFEEEQESNDEKSDDLYKAADMANNIDNMDLSAREKFNIQSQLKRCYKRAITETKSSNKIKISVHASISQEGYIDSDLDDTIDMERYNNPKETAYKIAIDNVRMALDLCNPLRNLPLDKYDIWKEAVFDFDED